MNGEQPSFGKRQVLGKKIELAVTAQPGLEIEDEVAHLSGHEMSRRRLMFADVHVTVAPPARPIGHQVPADFAVEHAEEIFIERQIGELAGRDALLGAEHALGD